MQEIYKKTMNLSLTNEEIRERLKDMNCSIEPIQGTDKLYHILYKTTCTATNKFYIGVHSSPFIKDRYIGNGINSNIIRRKSLGYGISHLKRAIEKYGYSNFERTNLLYFNNKQDLLEAERIIVNKEFIENSNTLNCCVGGSRPPTRKGPANGNYGNKWSLEKRKELSNFFKKNRDTKGGNNNRAIPVLCINLITERKYEFECMKDAGLFLNLKPDTIRKYRNEIGHIFKEFWIVIEKDRRDIDLKSLMIERITQLSFSNNFL